MPKSRLRSTARVTGRVLLGIVASVVLAAACLVLLAYWTPLKFDVAEVVIALVIAGIVVFLWTRWR